MVSRSPSAWPRQSSSAKNSLLLGSSIFNLSSISVHSFIFTHRQRSFTFPHKHHPSLPSCCSAGPNQAKSKPRNSNKQFQIRAISVNNDISISKKEQLPKRRSNQNYESLFGKRALWRRIAFASKKVQSIVLLNLITLIYASNISVLKEFEAVVDPAAFTVVRFSVSAIAFLPFVWRGRSNIQTRNSGIELGLWVSLGYLMEALGLLTSDAGRTSFISMFTVIVVPLIDGMLGAVIPARTWFGALMSIIGVGMLECSGSPPCIGDLLNFLSALFFGIHMIRTEHISRTTDKENFLPVLGYEVCVVAFLSIIWYFIGGIMDGSLEYHPSSWTCAMLLNWIMEFPWIPALYTGVFSTGLCLWVEMAAMRDISATETAIIYGMEPVWGAGFAWFLLGERWGVYGWFGAALVLGGSLMVQIIGASPEHSKRDVSDGLSASPVPVSSRKNVSDLLNK